MYKLILCLVPYFVKYFLPRIERVFFINSNPKIFYFRFFYNFCPSIVTDISLDSVEPKTMNSVLSALSLRELQSK